MKDLDQLAFDNSFARLPDAFYTRLNATPLLNPTLAAFSRECASLLDLEDTAKTRQLLTEICSGHQQWPGSEPLAMVYSGHQFGGYNPQLGDGRGLLLGEVRNSLGEKWDLHLKGAGKTPYSRFGDGRAVLRSCIREYLCSEALHHLGIPTTRALCIVTSDTPVQRETEEKGSTLLRVARTHIRFGHFEFFNYTQQHEALKMLADYTIDQHFPHLSEKDDKYTLFFREVLTKTAHLIARWQAVGFAHGVMNTDNMSILGETFDFGPYGFMDDFNWHYICNHSDHHGRYAFNQQPDISYWNCGCLARALLPLIDDPQPLQKAMDEYPQVYSEEYARLMGEKLGLKTLEEEDPDLIKDLLQVLHDTGCDYTLFFRQLCEFSADGDNQAIRSLFNNSEGFDQWSKRYAARLQRNLLDDQTRRKHMQQVNPKYVLRNYLAQQAIERAEEGDFGEIENLMTVLRKPFDEHPQWQKYAQQPPEWGRKLEVSCSS
ncbi:MAG: protein adenylyltransferase SelO [Endozoicomonas sp.]